ncbi:MAG: hypothetical protein J0L92_08555 [Deltaproteobacteria bacterium]|nr:hypothetical protein [Deltaproteobacteria bacterium]
MPRDCLFVLALLIGGCPPSSVEPDADLDAARARRDAPEDDAFLDPTIDAFRDDVYLDPAIDAYLLDAFAIDAGRRDAPFVDASPDAGPVLGCMGTPTPAEPCTNDDECRARGFVRCALPIHAEAECPVPCFATEPECEIDSDCTANDAGTEDAGRSAALVCNVYEPHCACPRFVCEAVAVPSCSDGFSCPDNSVCTPGAPSADANGCAPKPCTTSGDCDCGFCTSRGLCADGVGTCE